VLATLESIIGRAATSMIRSLVQAGQELESRGEVIEE
jgi:hypothetical protein